MPWVHIDDGFFGHPKIQRVGPHGAQLFLASLCYSSTYLTDGVVDKSALRVVAAWAGVKPSLSTQLCNEGLWLDRGGHWEIHDYLQYHPTRSEVEADRKAKHEAKVRAGQLGGIASGVARRKHEGSRPEANGQTNGQAGSKQNEAPSHPIPKDLHPPTTESRCGLTGRAGEVLKVLLAVERSNSGPVKNRAAWERTVGDRLTSEHGERISRLTAEYPDAPADVIAGQINGDATSLRYYQRKAPA